MKPEKLFRVQSQGVGIQVGQWPGPGPAVLCLHGLSANLTSFALLAQSLRVSHRVLAMDLRGRGLSDKPDLDYSLAHHCADIRAVAAGLGLQKITLMGHSLGAYIAMAMAARHPELVERLVLLDGGADLSPEQWDKVAQGIGPSVDRLGKLFPSFEAYLDLMRSAPYYRPWNRCIEEYFRYDVEDVAGGVRSRVDPEHIARERASLAQINPSQLHPRVACPTLVVRAAKGMLAGNGLLLPADALAAMIAAMPQARVADLEGTDHFSIVFQPNAARDRAILEFLA